MRTVSKSKPQVLEKELRRSRYFREAPEKFLEEMGQLCRETSLAKGTTVIKENSRATRFFILWQGAVALSIRRGKGELVTEIVKRKGDLIGWSALVSPRRYTATARTLEDSRVLSIHGKDMERLFQRHPSFGWVFFQKLAKLIATRLFHTRALLAETLS